MRLRRSMLKSKIHRAVVTRTNLNYDGSITLDPLLMQAADLVPFERVSVLNINNGARFDTYVIEGQAGTGAVELNGAAARLAQPGDLIIVLSYVSVEATAEELAAWQPVIVHVDERNQPVARLESRSEQPVRDEAGPPSGGRQQVTVAVRASAERGDG